MTKHPAEHGASADGGESVRGGQSTTAPYDPLCGEPGADERERAGMNVRPSANRGGWTAGAPAEPSTVQDALDILSPERIAAEVEIVLAELVDGGGVVPGQIVVIGTSTSEVAGKHIGTSGSWAAASAIFEGVRRVRERAGFYPAFQCCEHLNRALVVERTMLERYPLFEPVSVVPVPKAGGSMAAFAYRHLPDPVVIEEIRAHAGIDIGGTLIGMHLRKVAVPLRPSVRMIGHAPVQLAYTRPKLIGGARAVYVAEAAGDSTSCD